MRLLFITGTRIGDAILTTGLLDHVLTKHPGAAVTIACGAPAASLFAAVPGLERIIVMRKRRRAGHWFRLWREVSGTAWDHVLDLRGSAIAWTLWARRRTVWRGALASGHHVEQLSALLRLDPPANPRLWFAERNLAEAAALVPDGPPVLALAPIANWPGKQWPLDRFIAAAARLTGPDGALAGGRVAVFGAPHERPDAEPLFAALGGSAVIDGFGQKDLVTVAAALRRARLFIGNDSGLMHMSAAIGAPTLGLFGPSDPASHAPWGPLNASVTAGVAPKILRARLAADPALLPRLMDGIAVEAVVAAASRLIDRGAAA